MFGLPQIVAAGVLAAGLSGCTFLDLLLGAPPFDPTDPDFSFPPMPTAAAPFTEGTASLDLGDTTIVLDRLAGSSGLEAGVGVRVVWTNGEGWYLSYLGLSDLGMLSEPAYLSLDRIVGVEHWVVLDPTRCITTTDRSDSSSLAGTAICRGLQWSNFFSAYGGLGDPGIIPGQTPFDADIEFEAH